VDATGTVEETIPAVRGMDQAVICCVKWDRPHFVRRGSNERMQNFGIRQKCLEAVPAAEESARHCTCTGITPPPFPVGLGQTVNPQHADAIRLSKEVDKLPADAQFFIRPTYTPGSVALVDRHTAASVAALELRRYRESLANAPYARLPEHALARGLVGIVTAHWKHARTRFVFDLLTGETSIGK
jgi:hypothetical protein